VRPSTIVQAQPALADPTYLLEILEDVRVERLFAVSAIDSLDVGVLIGFAGLDVAQVDRTLLAQVTNSVASSSGLLPIRIARCSPRELSRRSNTRITRLAASEVSISIASPSRTPSSSTLKLRTRRPPHRLSLMKSTDQTWFGIARTSSG
jgi:hypothetical protein